MDLEDKVMFEKIFPNKLKFRDLRYILYNRMMDGHFTVPKFNEEDEEFILYNYTNKNICYDIYFMDIVFRLYEAGDNYIYCEENEHSCVFIELIDNGVSVIANKELHDKIDKLFEGKSL